MRLLLFGLTPNSLRIANIRFIRDLVDIINNIKMNVLIVDCFGENRNDRRLYDEFKLNIRRVK
jgi:hypothetical protein